MSIANAPDPSQGIRSPTLYPTELRARVASDTSALSLSRFAQRFCSIFRGITAAVDAALTPCWTTLYTWAPASSRSQVRAASLRGLICRITGGETARPERAARTGFDWPDIEGPKAKIREELDEIAAAPPEEIEEEVGDLLFAVVNFARFLKIEPEEALRKANRKFEARFRAIEQAPGFSGKSLDEMEELWVAAKKAKAEVQN